MGKVQSRSKKPLHLANEEVSNSPVAEETMDLVFVLAGSSKYGISIGVKRDANKRCRSGSTSPAIAANRVLIGFPIVRGIRLIINFPSKRFSSESDKIDCPQTDRGLLSKRLNNPFSLKKWHISSVSS